MTTTSAVSSGLSLEQVDPSVRLQDDLFGHVNGRWLRTHEIPADRSSDGAFHALRDLAEERVRASIEEAAADTDAALHSDHGRGGAQYGVGSDQQAGEATRTQQRDATTDHTT